MKTFLFISALAAFVFSVYHPSYADMVNLTGAQLSPNIAEYLIDEEGILLKLEIGELNKQDFKPLIEGNRNDQNEFLTKNFYIQDGKNRKLKGSVNLAEQRKRTPRPSPITNPPGGIMPSENVTYIEIYYPFAQRPESIIFNPPLNDDGVTSATVGFIVYHKDIPVIDFRYLPMNQKLRLNWNDPWYSSFENKNLRRHHSSPVMSFLYVEPYEVRHEILIRLVNLEEWLELDIGELEKLSVAKQEELVEKISEFIVERNVVKIDGRIAEPIVETVRFVKVNLMGLQYLNDPQEIEKISAIVGIILVYLTDGLPKEVTVDWDMFSDSVKKIPVVKSDPAGPFPDFITPEYSQMKWENYLQNFELPQVNFVVVEQPVISTVQKYILSFFSALISAIIIFAFTKYKFRKKANLSYMTAGFVIFFLLSFTVLSLFVTSKNVYTTEKHEAVLSSLLNNIYRSFDFKGESDIYDKLSTSIEGDLLTDMYLETRKNLEYENVGGAKAKIEEIKIEDIKTDQLSSGEGYKHNAWWTVSGKVEHWGHVHNRTNRYNAIITVKNIDGNWKITDFDLSDEQRVNIN